MYNKNNLGKSQRSANDEATKRPNARSDQVHKAIKRTRQRVRRRGKLGYILRLVKHDTTRRKSLKFHVIRYNKIFILYFAMHSVTKNKFD